MAVVNTPATNLEILGDMVKTGGAMGYIKIHLFQNNITPVPTNVVGDFIEADFPGYVASDSITWNTPYLDAGLNANVVGQMLEFELSSASVTQTIYGYYAVGKQGSDTVGITLIYSERFGQPVALNYEGQAVVMAPAYQFGQ